MSTNSTTFDLRITCLAEDGNPDSKPPTAGEIRAAVITALAGFYGFALATTGDHEIFIEEATVRRVPK